MMNSYNDALYANANYARIPATMMNNTAQNDQDFGSILMNGIKGAAQNAMAGMVNGAYESGQLQRAPAVQVSAGGDGMNLLILGVIAYMILK